MDSYRPFLFPLLSGSPHARRSDLARQLPGSTLEEENCLCGFLGQKDEVWDYLKEAVERNYGLPLISDLSTRFSETTFDKSHFSASPNRFLVMETNDRNWFLIEHPDSIPLIDRFSRENQTAAIARPSLFARLWREMEVSVQNEESGIIHVEEPPEAPAIALETFLSELLIKDHPSDWHLEPTHDHFRSRIRVDGCLQDEMPLNMSRGRWLINSLVSRAGLKERPGMPNEGRLSHQLPDGKNITLRISLVPAQHGLAMAVRFLYPLESSPLQLGALGLQGEECTRFNQRYSNGRGLWIVVGPTGSGKSTTLRAFLQLSIRKNEKVLSVEDPVEYTLQGVHHLSLGTPPGLTWAGAIRAFLRQAPDAILVGEIRDKETASIALQAARTGHRVLTTLHARDNPGVKRRFADLGQDEESLNSVFECVLHQRLLPRLCPDCRRFEGVPTKWQEWIDRLNLPEPPSIAKAVGCSSCRSGRKGRLAIFTSGDFLSTVPVGIELRHSAWKAFLHHQISFSSVIPFLPGDFRSRFGICQS